MNCCRGLRYYWLFSMPDLFRQYLHFSKILKRFFSVSENNLMGCFLKMLLQFLSESRQDKNSSTEKLDAFPGVGFLWESNRRYALTGCVSETRDFFNILWNKIGCKWVLFGCILLAEPCIKHKVSSHMFAIKHVPSGQCQRKDVIRNCM